MNHSTNTDIINNNTVEYPGIKNDTPDEPSLDYIRHVVQPLLHPYVDEPEIVILSWPFVLQLRQQALPHVATTRLDDWNHPEERDDDINEEPRNHQDHNDNNNDIGFVVAYLLSDYRVLSLHGLKDNIQHIHTNSHHTSISTAALSTQSLGESVDLNDDGCLSIELKPKAGYITCSPLVDPKYRIKFTQSRFSILQKKIMTTTTTATRIKKKKTSLYQQKSLYNPLDLFSQDESRISLALQHLWNCPRNNFCIWWKGQAMVMGDHDGVPPQERTSSTANTAVTTNTSTWTAVHKFLTGASILPTFTADQVAQQIIGNGGNDIAHEANTVSSDSTTLETTKHVLLSAISAILLKEPLLAKLQRLQLLDVIDADGALVIYHHLLQAFQGHSPEEVEAMIDAANVEKSTLNPNEIHQTRTLSHSHAPPPLLQASPFEPPDDPALAALCDHMTAFSQQLQQDVSFRKGNGDEHVRFTSSDFEHGHNEARQVALDFIEHSLTLESNIYLLQNWLLSLAMCDASFFITLRPVLLDDAVAMCSTSAEGFEEQEHGVMPEPQSWNSNNHWSSGAGSWMVQRTYRGDATPGIIFRYSSMSRAALQTTERNASPDAAFLYAVKVIDCDQKPARKLRTRFGKEQVFQDFFEITP
jgi:hypothetical protein